MSFLCNGCLSNGCGGCFEDNNEHSCKATKTNPNDLVMGTLSKREFIAAMAFSGMAANVYSSTENLPQRAVWIADMLIEELNK